MWLRIKVPGVGDGFFMWVTLTLVLDASEWVQVLFGALGLRGLFEGDEAGRTGVMGVM